MMPKVALVTGAARRIGLAIAECLGAHGYKVVIHCSAASLAEAKAAATRMAGHGVAVSIVTGDLADPAAPAPIIQEAARAFGPLGLLVNSAALFEEDSPFAIDLALWDQHFAVNLRAPLLLAQQFRSAGATGRGSGDRQHHRSAGAEADAAILFL